MKNFGDNKERERERERVRKGEEGRKNSVSEFEGVT